MTKNRLEAFSDGVLAIIITIMVLELKVPHSVTWQAISPVIPIFFSYILSFIILGIYWGNHHHLIHTVDTVNSKIIWANLHLLFWLSLIPFTTGWMGENNFDKITVAVYAALLFLCGLAYFILLKTIQHSHPHNTALLVPLHKQSRKGTISVLAYLAAIPSAFIHPLISGLLFLFVSIIWWIPDRNIEKTLKN